MSRFSLWCSSVRRRSILLCSCVWRKFVSWHCFVKPAPVTGVDDVFTPATAAVLTYVSRPGLETSFIDAFKAPGGMVLVYGQKGSGKTTLVINMLAFKGISTANIVCTRESSSEWIYGEMDSKLRPVSGGRWISDPAEQQEKIAKLLVAGEKVFVFEKAELLPPRTWRWIMDLQAQVEKISAGKSQGAKIQGAKIVLLVSSPKVELPAKYILPGAHLVQEVYVAKCTKQHFGSIISRGEHQLNFRFSEDVKASINKYATSSSDVHKICHKLCSANAVLVRQTEIRIIDNKGERCVDIQKYFKNGGARQYRDVQGAK